jgi:hypothetical protein
MDEDETSFSATQFEESMTRIHEDLGMEVPTWLQN